MQSALHGRVGRVRLLRRPLGAMFVQDLRRLNDTLRATDLSYRYWVFGGMLLGWARERGVLGHDNRDADFAIRSIDLPKLYAAIPALGRAGFRPLFRYSNHAGDVTELTFTRRGAEFEFFVMCPVGNTLRYFMYGRSPDGPVEVEVETQDQPLVPFDVVGRTWLKPEDHERELSLTYGDWRVPNVGWSYLDQPNIVDRRPWLNANHDWRP
jgi:hypothetical protein